MLMRFSTRRHSQLSLHCPKLQEIRAQHSFVDHRIRDIPKYGIAMELPVSLLDLPFWLRPIVFRAAHFCQISPEELDRQWTQPRSLNSLHEFVDHHGHPTRSSFPRGHKPDLSESPLLAKLTWSIKGHRLIKLELLPAKKLILNIYERRFGPDRFLIVDCLQTDKPPSGLKQHSPQIEAQIFEMLKLDQKFPGRTWVQILPKDIKGEVKRSNRDMSQDPSSSGSGTFKLFFFATSGDGLESISISQLVGWFIPLHLNLHQPACKAFTRLDLAMSRTVPALTFECSQIRYGDYGTPDAKATDVADVWPDRWSYDNQKRHREVLEIFNPEEVMSDGCSWISIAAMDCVRQRLKLDYIPAAVQGRIFGAKGVWCCYHEELPTPVEPRHIWISISKSQVKVRRDIHADTDELPRTLEVLKFSGRLNSSYFYPGFMPILLNQGVPAEVILEVARRHIRTDVDELVIALEDPSLLQQWLHSKHELLSMRNQESGMWIVAGFPNDHRERVAQMVEHGFKPVETRYLAEQVTIIAQRHLESGAKKGKVPLYQSASALGIADLGGNLAAGEIHFGFSEPIRDPTTGQSWSALQDVDVLVARNPAQRDSDIQKVRAVYHPNLAHCRDVVVFSTKGRRALASKLSGGDYDGDTFTVYWCPELVQPFRDAPAPSTLTPIDQLCISQDIVKLGDMIPSAKYGAPHEAEVRAFINRQTAARMRPSHLGIVTNAYGDLTYPNNDPGSSQATMYNDLHDYLVDADKNGHFFTTVNHVNFRRKYGIKHQEAPEYRKFAKSETQSFEDYRFEEEPQRKDGWTHILDRLYFDVFMKEICHGIRQIRRTLENAKSEDEDLVWIYDQLWNSADDSSIQRKEIESLKKKFSLLTKTWNLGLRRYHEGNKLPRTWQTCVEDCRTVYEDIQPDNLDHDVVIEWLRPQGHALNMWDKLKASTLAKYHHRSMRLLFSVVGSELCVRKAQMSPHRMVTLPLYLRMKPGKRRMVDLVDDLDADSDVPESEFDDSASLFDGFHDFYSAVLPSPKRDPQTPKSRKRLRRHATLLGEDSEELESHSKRLRSS